MPRCMSTKEKTEADRNRPMQECIRDRGNLTNKIYCTSFATEGEMTWGTEYTYIASWTLSIDRDFAPPLGEPDAYVEREKNQ